MPPLLKTSVSLVTVCDEASLFVQVTVDPTATVRVAGEKAKLDRITIEPLAIVAGVVGCVVLLPAPQAARTDVNNNTVVSDVKNGNNLVFIPASLLVKPSTSKNSSRNIK